jgi:predicted SprT family Zn-dependent metalloprotease
MTNLEIDQLFDELCIELELENWKMDFDTARRRAGCCSYRDRTIYLSGYFAAMNGRAAIEATLRHEIAHAKVGPRHGHDAVWQEMAVRCGVAPARCYDHSAFEAHIEAKVVMPEGRFKLTCPKCGRSIRQHRPRRNVACGKCVPGWTKETVMTVTRIF